MNAVPAAAGSTDAAAGDRPDAPGPAAISERDRRQARFYRAVKRGYLQLALFWLWTGASAVAARLLGVGGIGLWPEAAVLVVAAELGVGLAFAYTRRVLFGEGQYRPRSVVTIVTTAGSLLVLAFCVLDGFTILAATVLLTGTVLNLAAFAEANGFRATFLRSLLQTVIYGGAYVFTPKNALSLERPVFLVILMVLPVVGLVMGTIAARQQENRGQIVELLRVRERQTDELGAANSRLRELSMVDGLTGVANRRRFDEDLTRELGRVHRHRAAAIDDHAAPPQVTSLALILVDVDAFKAYNDSLGHLAGDECLRRVAAALRAALRRAGDSLARYGGEEFAILLPETDLAGARLVGERILRMVQGLAIPHPASPVASHVTVSGGISESNLESDGDAHVLIARADEALYRAKAGGRARMEVSARPDEAGRSSRR